MAREHRIAVVGATGAMGKELVAALDAAPWRPDHLLACARASTTVPFVRYGEEDVAVDDLAHVSLGEVDGVLVATPPEVAAGVIEAAVHAGVPVVDVSGSQLARLEVPLTLPWLTPGGLDAPRARDVVAVPSGPGALIAGVLGPLARAGWRGLASATVLLPASASGRDGIDELSQQVVALFNQGAPPRRVFEGGLAFDLMPQVGDVGVTGWSTVELRVAAEVARLTGVRCDVTVVGVPVFSGLGVILRLDAGDDLGPERAAALLVEAGVSVHDGGTRTLPRPRRVEGHALPSVARIRRGMDGRGLHLWAAGDNLRGPAAAAVAALAALLHERRAP